MPDVTAAATRAVIFGCEGPSLSNAERRFFRDVNPAGLILFARNCQDPAQVAALIETFRDVVGNDDPLVLIDQEGGRVQRLGPPHWPALPAARKIADLARNDQVAAENAARLLGRLLAADLAPLGITVNCAPVLDVCRAETHEIIADRSFGDHPDQVALLGRAVAEGLLAGGVLPVIKHMPGHGRARADSHLELPVVEAPRADLRTMDFAPFRALADLPLAMSAHVVFTAYDPTAPMTTSKRALNRTIRGEIGFGGVLMSDDINMQALDGDLPRRAVNCLRAGCDLVLHCSGDMAEMAAVADVVPHTKKIVRHWSARAERLRRESVSTAPFDPDAGLRELNELLAGGPA